MSKKSLLLFLALSSVATSSCAESAVGSIDADSFSLRESGKADSFSADVQSDENSVYLNGAVSNSLLTILRAASGLSSFRYNGVNYVLGTNVGCAYAGDVSQCVVATQRVEDTSTVLASPYRAKLHERRYSAGASELFAILARANGTSPTRNTTVSRDLFECEKTSRTVWCGVKKPAKRSLVLTFGTLPDVGPDYVYEGWLITPAGVISSGRFNAPAADAPVSFEIDRVSLETATRFVLTIEPVVGDLPGASKVHVLAGDVVDGEAILTIDHSSAIGTDFAAATGLYVLATPSTASNTADNSQGIWFVNPADGTAGFVLPTLPEGWVYEGWVAGADGPVSTGRFTSASGADLDGAGPTAGPDATGPFPGQDFINPPLDLLGKRIVLTVEPQPDTSSRPFPLVPLRDDTVEDIKAPATQTLTNVSAAIAITGMARVGN